MNKKSILILLFTCFLWQFSKAQTAVGDLVLMPVPEHIKVHEGKFRIEKDLRLATEGKTDERLYSGASRFLRRLDQRTGLFFEQEFITPVADPAASILITTDRPGIVKLGEDESYSLTITPESVHLTAATDIGALRGMETLLQLLKADEEGFYFPALEITDSPRFQWRGLMLDVSRHFLPIHVVKRNIDGMASVKMNVLHLHLVDDQGFRIESKVYPQLHEKASEGKYFTQNEIKEIIRYADERGIRVVPEFDVPGHASSLLVAFPELASAPGPYELIENAGIFDPTLNPTIDKTYEVLGNLFEEMATLFPDEYFHIGGDENEGKQWDGNKSIQDFMKKNNIEDNHELQAYFNNKLLTILSKQNKIMVGWDEILHPDLPNNSLIQSWRGPEGIKEAATKGYDVILSNGYYIDLMHTAADHYTTDPLPVNSDLTDAQQEHVLGGEATMWSELVDLSSVDSRIWPRTATIAERLWSPASVNDVEDMYQRLPEISRQLEEHGLTHITNRQVILRNISNGQNIPALHTLVDLVEPLEGYTRNPQGTMYTMYSPLTLFADAAIADAPLARKFNTLVDDYLQSPDLKKEEEILAYLNDWKDIHKQIQRAIPAAPILKSVEGLSNNLSIISALGYEVLSKTSLKKESSNSKDKEWLTQAKKKLETAREQGARTELEIVDAMEKLIMSKVI